MLSVGVFRVPLTVSAVLALAFADPIVVLALAV
jgi:hypothetical protein